MASAAGTDLSAKIHYFDPGRTSAEKFVSIDISELSKFPALPFKANGPIGDLWLTVDQFDPNDDIGKFTISSKHLLEGSEARRNPTYVLRPDVELSCHYTFKLYLGNPYCPDSTLLDTSTYDPLLRHTFSLTPKFDYDFKTGKETILGREDVRITKLFCYTIDCSRLDFSGKQELSIAVKRPGMGFEHCIKQKGESQSIKKGVAGKAEDGLLTLSLKLGRTAVARGELNPYEHLSALVRTTAPNTHVFEYVPVHELSTVSKKVSALPQLQIAQVDDEQSDVASQPMQAAKATPNADREETPEKPWYSTILDGFSFNPGTLRQIN